ncbi:hypothetical protein FIBSPDRAFT_777298 [Athelia psychrophila]|uniref:RING-type E3 ubiquitin transferase n=1 Tax=Athelia psychrophila TaxID=1759441 RepID=A0A166TET8_9AGAM|nr:hypothetical protein FIBSPDRAFT_777298 [Fibularhizoctonia sp. CBS 109695]
MENEEEGVRPPPPRPRSSIPSFLFITFLLFMLTNHSGDEFLARNQYQNALHSLQWQLGNYTAWMNGTETNFTLLDTNPALQPLVESFILQGTYLNPNKASYYSNITGFLRGEVDFHNITHTFLANSSVPPGWAGFANELVGEANETDITERSSSWNWAGSNKVSLSVVEKNPGPEWDVAEGISLIHGHVEFLDSNSSEELRLDFEGIHFVANGSIYGFAEPQGRDIDIRLLPSIVPSELQNITAHAIVPQLTTRITRLKNLIDAGIIDQDAQSAADETPKSTCPFTVHAQLEPTDVPSALLQELEEETQKPTGKWTVPVPKLSLRGVVVSQECGVLYEMKNISGLSSHEFFRKVTTYAGFAAIAYLTLLVLLSRQMDRSRTPAGISRLTRWSFLTQSIVDSVAFAGHITFAILADGRPALSLVAPAFLACILFVNEAQFSLLINQIQAPEDNAPTPAPTTAPTPPTTTPSTPNLPGPTTPSTPVPATNPTTTAQQPSTLMLSLLWSFIRGVHADPHAKLWITMFIFLSVVVRVIMSPSMTMLFVGGVYSFFWMPQIVRSARRGRSSGLTAEYLVGTTICRLYFLLYFLACPKNVLDVDPRWWSYLLALFMSLQVVVILLQEHLGPAFFLPKRFVKAKSYDYHPPMPLPDPESPEQSLGDCAICMDAIILEGSQRRRKSLDQWGDHGLGSGGGGLLNAVQMGVGGNGARKNYSLAPCHHLFHTACLERWLAIKNICPQCRRPLPPL